MNRLVFAAPSYRNMADKLLLDDRETCAILFVQVIASGSRHTRIIVREIDIPADDAYTTRTSTSAVLRSDYVLQVANKARIGGHSIVFAHTHPRTQGVPEFSLVDDRGEEILLNYFGS